MKYYRLAVSICFFYVIVSLTPYFALYQFYTDPHFEQQEETIPETEITPTIPDPPPDNNEENEVNEQEILYYAEALHGGLLLSGLGNDFQYSTYYVLDKLFDALEQYDNYKVCLELEPSTISSLNQTYVDRLKAYIEDGRVEILLTSFDQNFLLNVSYDFALYSLRLAKETIETVFDYTPKVFAAQEMALRPDLPQLLQEVDIPYVLGRVWMSYWGNMKYWKQENNQDLLTWKYNDSSVILIPDYHNVWTWDFSEKYVSELINKSHEAGIKHPLQVSFDDLEIWKKWESVKTNRSFPFFHKDNELVKFVTLTEYIEEIADEPKDEVEISSSYFKLRLLDKKNYTNWEDVKLNSTQFELIVNGTQELAEIWLEHYTENKTNPLVKELFKKLSRLYFHDIWVCYNYAFGSCVDEGFENWFAYWNHYYQLTVDFLNSHNITIA